MNYELAKKLKESGFPTPSISVVNYNNLIHPYYIENGTKIGYPVDGQLIDSEWVYIPNLEELIEACGEKFSQLNKWDIEKEPLGKWSAVGDIPYNEAVDSYSVRTDGSTPSEAVANLWLELQDKK